MALKISKLSPSQRQHVKSKLVELRDINIRLSEKNGLEGIAIGSDLTETLSNLIAALDDDRIQGEQLDVWLAELSNQSSQLETQ